MALLTLRHRDWVCFLVLPPQTSDVTWGWSCLSGSFRSHAPKLRTSADSSQPEGASQKAVAQPHVPMALLAQRHRDWGCLLVLQPQTSNVTWGWGSWRSPFAGLLLKCERLQIARRQKGIAWEALAQPHVPMALLAHRNREWVCLLVLPPQTSNVA